MCRFYDEIEKAKTGLFVWWNRDKIVENALLNHYYMQLSDKFKNQDINILVFKANTCIGDQVEYLHIKNNVMKVIGDFAACDINNLDSAIQGNKKNSNSIFSLIYRNPINVVKNFENLVSEKNSAFMYFHDYYVYLYQIKL